MRGNAGALSVVAAYGCAITSSWTAVRGPGFPVSDLFLLVLLGGAVWRFMVPPGWTAVRWWMFLGLFSGLLCVFAGFLSPGVIVGSVYSDSTSTVFMRLLAATTLTAIGYACLIPAASAALPRRLAAAWLAGATVSAIVAVLGGPGALGLAGLVPSQAYERASGLSVHPNSLACSLVVAIPVAVWGITCGGRWRPPAAACLMLLLWALLLADSRAGLIIGFGALVVSGCCFIGIRVRGTGRAVTIGLYVVGVMGVAWMAAQGSRLLVDERLVSQSDTSREAAINGGWELFQNSPVFGNGIASGSGISVPILLLSSGGLVLFLG